MEVRETSLDYQRRRILNQISEREPREVVDIQISSVVPDWTRDISSKSVDKDLVLIEFENDIGQPPRSVSLEALPVAGGPPGCGDGLEGFFDHLWNLLARGQSKSAS